MPLHTTLRAAARALVGGTRAWRALANTDLHVERLRHTVAERWDGVIAPAPRHLEIAITAQCNLRCMGCRYGRDFMPGHRLTWPVVRDLLDDAKAAGIWDVRFYGGEPLLHPELPRMVAHATALGLGTYVTTNGMLLGDRIDALVEAGLRTINIGYYGTGAAYDAYVQRPDRHARLDAGLARLRARHGDTVAVRINWLLKRPSATVAALRDAWEFALRHDARFQMDLVHYSLPYFTEGPERELQFRPEDRRAVELVVEEMLRLKARYPDRLNHTVEGIRSVVDWVMRGPEMRIPCDAYQMLWVGADGSVQQCYVTHRLGSLHEARLRDLIGSAEHRAFAREAFNLACPNCHCHYDRRIQKHAPSRATYASRTRSAQSTPARAPLPVFGEAPVRS